MDLKGGRFLVIGGGGLIGSHTVEALLKEDVKEVIVFDNFVRGSEENIGLALQDPRCSIFPVGGDILQTDILDAAMKDIDGVFHFAALWLLQCHEYPRSAFDVNIRGTFNIIESCMKNQVKRLVYSSSASVYGDALTEPMAEDHPFNNLTFYGATKVAGEQMCRAFFHRYNLPYVGLRYMNVYGPRQDYKGAYIAVIMKILDRLDQGLPPVVYGDGSQAYDFIYVGDCARANVCAMQSDVTDEMYNVGSGVKTTIKQVAEMLLELTGSDLEIQYEPAGQTFVKNRVGCPQKAKEQIGFSYDVELKEGLLKLIEWRKVSYRGGRETKKEGVLTMKIPITRPVFDDEDKEYLLKPMETGWVVQGPYTAEFEQRFAEFSGARFASAVTSCTTALHLGLEALGVGPGDKVIVPSFTYIASANAVEYLRAEVVFCDIDLRTFNIDVQKVKALLEQDKDRSIKAVMPVNLFGLCADLPALMGVAEEYGVAVIEDSACGMGAYIDGKHSGTFGAAGCFSLPSHSIKAISTGDRRQVLIYR